MLSVIFSVILFALSFNPSTWGWVFQDIGEGLEINQTIVSDDQVETWILTDDSISNGNLNDTQGDKTQAYNTAAEREMGYVANIALEHSNTLVSCTEDQSLCEVLPTPIPTTFPTIIPTITPPVIPPITPPVTCPPLPPCHSYITTSDSGSYAPNIYSCPPYPDQLTTEEIICLDEEVK